MKTNKILSILLAIILIMGMMPISVFAANAQITYINWQDDYTILFETDQNCSKEYFNITFYDASDDQYIFGGDAQRNGDIIFSGNRGTITKECLIDHFSHLEQGKTYYAVLELDDPAISSKRTASKTFYHPRLTLPSNLRWEKGILKWDPTPNATRYRLNVFGDYGGGFRQLGGDEITKIPEFDYRFFMQPFVKYKMQVGAEDTNYQYIWSLKTESSELRATQDILPHDVTVTRGKGGGKYFKDDIVTLKAYGATEHEKHFIHWNSSIALEYVDGTNNADPNAKFKMPAEDVTITPFYDYLPLTLADNAKYDIPDCVAWERITPYQLIVKGGRKPYQFSSNLPLGLRITEKGTVDGAPSIAAFEKNIQLPLRIRQMLKRALKYR